MSQAPFGSCRTPLRNFLLLPFRAIARTTTLPITAICFLHWEVGCPREFSPRTPASKAPPGSPDRRSASCPDCGRDERDRGTTLFLELKLQLCPDVFVGTTWREQ